MKRFVLGILHVFTAAFLLQVGFQLGANSEAARHGDAAEQLRRHDLRLAREGK